MAGGVATISIGAAVVGSIIFIPKIILLLSALYLG